MNLLLPLLVGGLIMLLRKLFLEGGLEKMLEKLNGELNQPGQETRRTTVTPARRQMPPQRPAPANAEELRMRRFREALGLPPELAPSLAKPAPLRAQPVPSFQVPVEENAKVAEYFHLEEFDRPPINLPSAMELRSEISPPAPARRAVSRELNRVFGAKMDLRRLILAQEILGRPKSLQTS